LGSGDGGRKKPKSRACGKLALSASFDDDRNDRIER
jgi:hypothetical protein